jgi:hypothetical protein
MFWQGVIQDWAEAKQGSQLLFEKSGTVTASFVFDF